MSSIKVLVVEYVSKDIEFEDILSHQNFQTFSLLPDALDIKSIANEIKTDVILINSRKVTDSIMKFITDIYSARPSFRLSIGYFLLIVALLK